MEKDSKSKISVIIRKRPLTSKEQKKQLEDIIDIKSYDTLHIKEKKQKVDLTKYTEKHQFTFDAVYGENHDNHYIYIDQVQPLIKAVFQKAKVTCFAYGQTGSGKTWTMMGANDGSVDGLYNMAAKDLFKILEDEEHSNLRVGVSFYEIYCGKAYDLLNGREGCAIRVDRKEKVNIVGLTEKIVPNIESLVQLINQGLGSRIVGKTGMNENSSRSHAIMEINLRNAENGKKHGKLSFIDLAGSERGGDVKDTNKKTRHDGAEINKSLLALKECIRALDLAKKHLPFRGSKLTLVLKDSFIGKCQTVMIGNISPAIDSCENTLNTLRYADRVKELKEGSGKQHADKSELMLARDGKNTIIEFDKPKLDNHIQFEEYNVNDKGAKNQSVVFKKPAPKESSEEEPLDESEEEEEMHSYEQRKKPEPEKRYNNTESQRVQTKRETSKQELFQERKPQSSKNNFLKNDSQMSKNFLGKKKSQQKIQPVKQKQRRDSSYSSEENKLQRGAKQELVKFYKNHVQNMVGVTRSDMRNAQLIESGKMDFDKGFKKMIRNLDEKINEINQLKKEIKLYQQRQEEEEDDSRRSFSENDDPFATKGDNLFD